MNIIIVVVSVVASISCSSVRLVLLLGLSSNSISPTNLIDEKEHLFQGSPDSSIQVLS